MPISWRIGALIGLLLGSEEGLLLDPWNSAASALQQLRRPVQTLAPSSELRGMVPCRGAETEFRVSHTPQPDFTPLRQGEFVAGFLQFHHCAELSRSGPLGDLLEDSEVDSEDLLFGSTLLPHREFPEAEGHAVACAVSLSEPPHQGGRFVPPELDRSRDRRGFRLFNDHICRFPPEKTSG